MTKRSLMAWVGSGILMALSLQGCGGAGMMSIDASVAVPFELLSITSYEVDLALLDPTGTSVVRGPLKLLQDDVNGQWVGEVEDVSDQDLLAIVEIVVPFSDGSDIVLGRAHRSISVPKDASFMTLTFKPLDFDTSMDDDGDTLTNAFEYANNLNPESVDTDGDGISDANEIGGVP